jgi:uncharacterized protein YfeS
MREQQLSGLTYNWIDEGYRRITRVNYKPVGDAHISDGVAVQLVFKDDKPMIRVNSALGEIFLNSYHLEKLEEEIWAYDSAQRNLGKVEHK